MEPFVSSRSSQSTDSSIDEVSDASSGTTVLAMLLSCLNLSQRKKRWDCLAGADTRTDLYDNSESTSLVVLGAKHLEQHRHGNGFCDASLTFIAEEADDNIEQSVQ
jgi:hypothetical protein